jgi:C4-dicarboxylate transporter DctM subunit
LVNAGFAQFVLKSLLAITDNASVAMLLLMVGLFILGLPIEPIPALIMVVPIVAPVLAHYGINEIQFGMAAIMMLVLGSLTPPIGVLAMIACRMAKLEYGKSILMMTPFMLWWLSVTMLVAFVPAISLWLPSLVIP